MKVVARVNGGSVNSWDINKQNAPKSDVCIGDKADPNTGIDTKLLMNKFCEAMKLGFTKWCDEIAERAIVDGSIDVKEVEIISEYVESEILDFNRDNKKYYHSFDSINAINEYSYLKIKDHVIDMLYASDEAYKFSMDDLLYLDKILFDKISEFINEASFCASNSLSEIYARINSTNTHGDIPTKLKVNTHIKMLHTIADKTCESVVKYMEFNIDLKPILEHMNVYFNLFHKIVNEAYAFVETTDLETM